MKHESIFAWTAFAIVCIVWGTTYLAIRVAIETLPTFLFAGTRFALGGLILLALCAMKGLRFPKRKRDLVQLAWIGLLMVGAGNVCVVWAEHYMTSGFAALFVATAPLTMAALEAMRRDGERMNLRKTFGTILGFSGVGLLLLPELTGDSINTMFLLGVVAIQLGSLGWNIGSIRSKYHPIKASPLVTAGFQMLFGGIAVSIIGLARGELPSYAFNGRTLAAFVYLVVFGSVLAYGAFIYALSKLPTSTVTLHAYVNPAVAVVCGWAILDEPLGWIGITAMAVILAGVALVRSGGDIKATAHPSKAPNAAAEAA